MSEILIIDKIDIFTQLNKLLCIQSSSSIWTHQWNRFIIEDKTQLKDNEYFLNYFPLQLQQ